jgi:hypothetical protein
MSGAVFLPRAQVEEIRYQQREWKAGYAAAVRHNRWTTVGVALVVFAALRRWRVPVLAIAAWGLALILAFWWLILILLAVEVGRRRRVHQALAITFVDDPFPEP